MLPHQIHNQNNGKISRCILGVLIDEKCFSLFKNNLLHNCISKSINRSKKCVKMKCYEWFIMLFIFKLLNKISTYPLTFFDFFVKMFSFQFLKSSSLHTFIEQCVSLNKASLLTLLFYQVEP